MTTVAGPATSPAPARTRSSISHLSRDAGLGGGAAWLGQGMIGDER